MLLWTVFCVLMVAINDPCRFCPPETTRETTNITPCNAIDQSTVITKDTTASVDPFKRTNSESTTSYARSTEITSVTELSTMHTAGPTPHITKFDEEMGNRLFKPAMNFIKESIFKETGGNIVVSPIGNITFSVLLVYIEFDCIFDQGINDIKYYYRNYPRMNTMGDVLMTFTDITIRNDTEFACDNPSVEEDFILKIEGDDDDQLIDDELDIQWDWSKFSKNYSSVSDTTVEKHSGNNTPNFAAILGEYREVKLGNIKAEFITLRSENSNDNISMTIVPLPPSGNLEEFSKTVLSNVSYIDFFNTTEDKRTVHLPNIDIFHSPPSKILYPLRENSTSEFMLDGRYHVVISTTRNENASIGQQDDGETIDIVHKSFIFFIMWKKIIIASGIRYQ